MHRLRRRSVLWGLAAAWAATAVGGVATGQGAGVPIEPFRELRFEEDWSALALHTSRIATDPWLSWKYAPLAITDTSWLSIGGALRYRGELREGVNLGVTPTGIVNEDAHLVRARLYASLYLIEGFRIYAEGIFADVYGRDSVDRDRVLDADDPDLLDVFIESRAPVSDTLEGALRVGRQQITLGDGRLVGADDWQNAPRRFDGVHVLLTSTGFEGSAFLFNEVERDTSGLDDSNEDDSFLGADLRWFDEAVQLHAYGLGVHRDVTTVAGESGEENRATVGLGATIPFFLGTRASAEGAFQFGEIGQAQVRAFMWVLALERDLAVLHGGRAAFEVSYASGDDRPGDGRVDTFDQLFPDTHRFHGIADVVGGQNLLDVSLRADVSVTAALTTGIALHRFMRADKTDGVYGAQGDLAFAAHPGSRHVADEIDVYAEFELEPHWTVRGGFAYVATGEFLDRVPRSDDQAFIYLGASYRF